MAESSQAPGTGAPREPRPVGGDLIIPIGALVFTLYYFSTIWDLTWEAQINGLVIGCVLLALIAIFLVRTALRLARGDVTLGLGGLVTPPQAQRQRAAMLVLSVAFIPLIDWLGFTLAVALFLFCGLFALGIRDRKRLIWLPLGLSLAGYFLFIAALDTRFPHGPVEWLLGGLF